MKHEDPDKYAESAGLRYISEEQPGFTRKIWGRGFIYLDEKGKKVKDPQLVARFKGLVIPPAWKDVWICKGDNCHLQVTGYDEKGRKQYIYHEEWNKLRNETKYDQMYQFGKALPEIRRIVGEHLRKKGLPREKVLAAIVQLLQEAMIRVGNKNYARDNKSYGLTTLRKKHVELNGRKAILEFIGKSGKEFKIDISNTRLVSVLKKCNELPGYDIFKYVDEDGNKQYIDSGDVNEYIREISGKYFTAKYFRTWGGSVEALVVYLAMQDEELDNRKNMLTQVVRKVSERLNNTVSICRDYYVHPAAIDIIENKEKIDLEKLEIEEEELTLLENYFLTLINPRKRKNARKKASKKAKSK